MCGLSDSNIFVSKDSSTPNSISNLPIIDKNYTNISYNNFTNYICGVGKIDRVIDFSSCEELLIPLGGAMDKICILYNESVYLLKFDKPNSSATISEYIASRLCNYLHLPCQEVLLGYYKGRRCCAIKSFNNYGLSIHCYKEINDSSVVGYVNDVSDIPYNLNNIKDVIINYKNCRDSVDDRLNAFQVMCLFDTVIGNFDRHWGNWGLLGTEKDYIICPLFDNGSSLFPSRDIKDLSCINDSVEEMMKRVYTFPTSQIRNSHNNKKMSYKDLVINLVELFGDNVLRSFVELFESVDLKDLIFNDYLLNEFLCEEEKEFLFLIINLRFEILVKGVFIDA